LSLLPCEEGEVAAKATEGARGLKLRAGRLAPLRLVAFRADPPPPLREGGAHPQRKDPPVSRRARPARADQSCKKEGRRRAGGL